MLEILKAAFLALIQGATEFLPVSSSGHLAVFNAILNTDFNIATFSVAVHFATMLATVVVFFREIIELFLSLGKIPAAFKEKKIEPKLKVVIYIVLASIPTAAAGLFLNDYFEELMTGMTVIGIMLMLTGGILLLTKFIKPGNLGDKDFGFGRSLLLGVAQSIAILPGISRSGTTISAAVLMKADREFAGRISFLISLPAIAGAAAMDAYKVLGGEILLTKTDISAIIVGFVVAFATGFFALKLLLKIVKGGNFYKFAPYCLAVGLLVLILSLTGVLS